MKRNTILACLATVAVLTATACSSDQSKTAPESETSKVGETVIVEEADNSANEVEEVSESDTQEDTPESESQSDDSVANAESADNLAQDDASENMTLAKRLCGRYSCKGSDEEYYILDIREFADNLYAHAGAVFAEDDQEYLESYSFWGVELIPEDEGAVRSVDADTLSCHVLAFSIMSNLTKYQAPPAECTITLTDDGIEVEGFFLSADSGKTVFKRDDRVEDAFPYMNNEEAGTGSPDERLVGLWREKDAETPLYFEFGERGSMWIYNESPGTEVYLGGGEYHGTGEHLIGGAYSCLGGGTMPVEYEMAYTFSGDDELELDMTYDDFPVQSGKSVLTFERIEEKDVPVVTIDKVREVLTDDHIYDMYAISDDNYDDGFYGVWVGAFESRDEADDLAEQIKAKGYDAYVVFSPEWENLSPKSYYCVTFDKCMTETWAEGTLVNAQSAGFDDAYVKFSGKRVQHRICYTVYSHDEMEFHQDKVILNDVHTSSNAGDESGTKTLIIDKDTIFDPSCQMEPFANYEDGDTVLGWFLKNDELARNDPDSYSQYGPALIGVFDVSITGDHIDRFYGCYWWD
jgi:hypothetical protein